MNNIPKNGIPTLISNLGFEDWDICGCNMKKANSITFSKKRAKELLAYEKELKSMRKVAIENYRSVK